MGAVHPGLQIGDRAVSPRQQLFAGRRGALAAPPVFKAALANPAVAHPPVGVHDRSGGGGSADKPGERGARGIGQDAQAQTSRAAPANLNRDPDQRLVTARTTALTPYIEATEIELVDLDLARQRLALGRDHRAPQLLQDQPRRLIARQGSAGAGAASPRSPDGAWRPSTPPKTTCAAACASGASPSPP